MSFTGATKTSLMLAVLVTTCGCMKGAVDRRETRDAGGRQTPQEKADPEQAPDDIQRFIAMLQSQDSEEREWGAVYLAKRGPRAAPALPYLIPLLDDKADGVCVAAVRAICAVGPQAASAIPSIVRAARKRLNEEGQCWATPYNCALGAEAVTYLVAELGANADTDEIPETMLANVGPPALPALQAVLGEGGYRAQSAASVLWRMRLVAKPAVPSLVRAVREGKITDFKFADALRAIGAESPEAVAELERIAKESKDPGTQEAARAALGRVP